MYRDDGEVMRRLRYINNMSNNIKGTVIRYIRYKIKCE